MVQSLFNFLCLFQSFSLLLRNCLGKLVNIFLKKRIVGVNSLINPFLKRVLMHPRGYRGTMNIHNSLWKLAWFQWFWKIPKYSERTRNIPKEPEIFLKNPKYCEEIQKIPIGSQKKPKDTTVFQKISKCFPLYHSLSQVKLLRACRVQKSWALHPLQ